MNYILRIQDREYLKWTVDEYDAQAGFARPGPIGLPPTFHPYTHKLFDGDHFQFTEDSIFHFVKSPLREPSIRFPAILILADGKTYGRTINKKRLLYKCIPHNHNLPAFLVPYDIKLELSKHIQNKYVVINYIHWEDKHPLGELVETLGAVNSYDAFEQYQLHCKCLHTSISAYSQHIKTQFLQTNETILIDSITQTYPVQDRTSEYIFSIDNETTTDYDDAMSITENLDNGSIRISIYISNVVVWLQALDGWTRYSERVSTIYLPTRKIPMLPSHLSENLCSLIEKRVRFSIVMDYIISSDGSVSISFSNTKIIVKKNYRYESENLLRNPKYQQFLRITRNINPSIKDSHELVAFWMIKMNESVGDMLYKNQVGIFRLANSKESINNSQSPQLNTETERMLYNFYNHISSEYRAFHAGEQYTHSAMLLENYVHFTSPIRRLVDLLNQIYLWKLIGNIPTPEMEQFITRWTSSLKIDYINDTMKSIRRTQTACELVHICYTTSDVFRTYSGIIFEKRVLCDSRYEYTVYIKDLKHLARIASNDEYDIRGVIDCRVFVFHDKSTIQDKILLQIVAKN